MEMKPNIETSSSTECIALMPINLYETKLSIKQKLCQITKRAVDILAGLVGTIILIPLTISIYIAHKITKDEGPIFYNQYRIGKNGKPFKMYKYRTMVMNADEELEKYLSENEDMREEYNTYKKLKNDPRTTKLGKFLRRSSLDEMAQLVNVLKGEMSLVRKQTIFIKRKRRYGKLLYTHN